MDFSKTKLYQRTRSCYDKLYLEFNAKKNGERLSNGLTMEDESSGKSSEGLRRSDGRRDEIGAGSRKGLKGKLGKVSQRGKKVSGVGLIFESDDTDDDNVGLNKCLRVSHSNYGVEVASASGKVETKLRRGKFLKRCKNVSRNSHIEELEDGHDYDDVMMDLSESSGRNQNKIDAEEAFGVGNIKNKFEDGYALLDRVCLEAKMVLGNCKSVRTNHSQKIGDDDDDALSHLGYNAESSKGAGRNCHKFENDHGSGTIEKNPEKGFVNNPTAANGDCLKRKRGLGQKLYTDTSMNSHGCSLDESDDDSGVIYLGDDVTCLDDYAPSHGSRVESNEVKVGAMELDSNRADDGDDNSLAIESSEEDDDDWQELESSEEGGDDDDNAGDTDFIAISSSSSSDHEDVSKDIEEEDESALKDGNDDDSSVLEIGNIDGTRNRCLIEALEKGTSNGGEEDKEDDEGEWKYCLKGKPVCEQEKRTEKQIVIEHGFGEKRCGDGNDKDKTIEGGLKKGLTDNTDTSVDCGIKANEGWCRSPATGQQTHFHSLPKLKKNQPGSINQPILVEDDFPSKDANDGGDVENFVRIIDGKGTQKAVKSTYIKHSQLGNKIDVIRILTDTIREEGDGDKLLKKYISPLEETPPEENPDQRILSYKFKFEEEEDKEPDKLESEMEVHGLFSEMNMCLHISDIGSSSPPVIDCDDADPLVEETDQGTHCRRGQHQLTVNDQFGIICRCCSYVEMEIRDILPPLVRNEKGGHDRYEFDKADSLKFSGLRWHNRRPECIHDYKSSKYEKGTVWDLVPGVQETMYPHQREGFLFIWKKIAGGTYIEQLEKRLPNGGSGCIISHAPGTGKSRLTIVFLQAFMRMYPDSRPLIIAPRCMLLTWEEEFKKWDVDIPFFILNSNEFSGQEDRVATTLLKQAGNGKTLRSLRLLKLYSWKKRSSILGITYRLFETLAGDERKRKQIVNNPEDEEIKRILLQVPTLLVLDEGHTPRNDQSLVWKALLNVKTKRSIILSGTPFQNNFDELYNTLCLVNPLLFFGNSSIRSDELSKKRGWKNNAARGQWASITSSIRKSQHELHKLRAMIDPFVHVHKGTILQERLPGLRDALVVLKPTKMQQTLLGKMIGSKPSLENDHLMSLISIHPSLLPKVVSDREGFRKVLKIFERDPRAGVKTNFLMELIKLSEALNEKVLVFSQYIKPLEFIMKLLKTNYDWVEGREFLYMDGKQEEKHRQLSINRLNDPKSEVKLLLASLRACSEGISLVGASRVVLLDVHWNPSVERQAISRAYRLGQKKLVHVYHLVTGTVEGEKYIRQVEKSHLSELVFSSKNRDSCNPKISSTVSADKILEEMVQHEKLQGMFEKVIYQPKESDLIHTFG